MFTAGGQRCLRLGFVLLLALCGAFPSQAWAKIHFVYRFDTRPPSEIFSTGFVPRGNNADLLQHVISSYRDDSAFIGTTSSYEAALRFARTQLRGVSDVTGYIYEIAADDSFYEVTSSLEGFLERERAAGIHPDNRFMALTVDMAIAEFRWEHEFVATRPIAASSIYWGIEVNVMRESHGSVRVEQGSRHDHASPRERPNTFANLDPYPVTWSSGAAPTLACADSNDDAEGPAGVNCTGDLYAAADGGDYVHPAMLPWCSSPQNRQKEKRSIDTASCSGGVSLINLSKLARANVAIISSKPWAPPEWRRDEL